MLQSKPDDVLHKIEDIVEKLKKKVEECKDSPDVTEIKKVLLQVIETADLAKSIMKENEESKTKDEVPAVLAPVVKIKIPVDLWSASRNFFKERIYAFINAFTSASLYVLFYPANDLFMEFDGKDCEEIVKYIKSEEGQKKLGALKNATARVKREAMGILKDMVEKAKNIDIDKELEKVKKEGKGLLQTIIDILCCKLLSMLGKCPVADEKPKNVTAGGEKKPPKKEGGPQDKPKPAGGSEEKPAGGEAGSGEGEPNGAQPAAQSAAQPEPDASTK